MICLTCKKQFVSGLGIRDKIVPSVNGFLALTIVGNVIRITQDLIKVIQKINTTTRIDMANVKKGNLTRAGQWWKHLKEWKRIFWKAERQAQKKDIDKRRD